MLERDEPAGISPDLPEGFHRLKLEELLPPRWLRPAPADAGEMQSLADGLLVEVVLSVADRTVDAGMGQAAFVYMSEVLERGIGSLMAEGWPVYGALQGVAGVLNAATPLPGDLDTSPEVTRFVETCRVEAARHRAGEPMRLGAGGSGVQSLVRYPNPAVPVI